MNVKPIYQKISMRERVLLIGFVWVILSISLSHLLKWSKQNRTEWNNASSILQDQARLFSLQPNIESELSTLQQRFNQENTYNANKLRERVDKLARNLELVFINAGSVKTESSTTGRLHTLIGSIKRVEIVDILEFEASLREEYPYIRVESMKLTAEASNPEFLTARFVVQSFELQK